MNLLLALCDKSSIVEIMLIVKTLFKIACYITPLLVIIISIIHIFKSVFSGKDDDLKDALKVTVKRIIAGLLIAFFPALINYVFTNVVNAKEVEFLACFESASKEKVESLKAKEKVEEDKERKSQEKEDEAELRKAWEAEQKQKGAKKQSFEEWKKNNSKNSTSTGNLPFNLEHAIQVHDNVHWKGNSDLKWHGDVVGHNGGDIGAYTEAVNILNEKDYRIYEVYNVLHNMHPEIESPGKSPHDYNDLNDYYNINVSKASPTIENITNALNNGCLAQHFVHSNKWRNDKGELLNWPGNHFGLIFYYDGTYYHMKAAGSINQSNAIYTREQLIEWIDTPQYKLVVYCKK